MADRRESTSRETRRYNARGSREVVYCHQCELDWYRDDYGLTCPRCDGEITEIISPDTDPRHRNHSPIDRAHSHGLPADPWRDANNSDPGEADIEEHVSHGPNGSTFVRTSRSSTPRNRAGETRAHGGSGGVDPGQAEILRNFQSMLGNLLGPGARIGQPGRSGPETLFSGPGWTGSIRVGGREGGPQFTGGAFTFSSRRAGEDAGRVPGGGPQMDDPFSMLDSMFGQMHPAGGHNHGPFANIPGHPMPPHMPGLFGLFNPAHAVSGDAVYSQEALDRIMSQLMEQHPTSNAPGPASKGDIDALPKRRLTEKILGPEGKGECSVCMDDVHVGDEVVFLPCNHWFHEACASAWLSEHNTCPICRTGIDGHANDTKKQEASASAQPGQPGSSFQNPRTASSPTRRASTSRHLPSMSRPHGTSTRNENRLNAIRDAGRVTPPERRGSASEYDEPPRRNTMPNVNPRSPRGGRNIDDTPPALSTRSRRFENDDDGNEVSSRHRRRRESEAGSERTRHGERDRMRERDRDRGGHGDNSGSSAEYRRGSRAEGSRSGAGSGSGSGPGGSVTSWLREHWGSGGSRY